MLAREKATQRSLPATSGGLTFHAHSFADDAGRLFWHGTQLCRGINAEHAPFVARLFDDGVIGALVERGLLIESEITELAVDQYAMVLRHKVVPFVSYPNEWCAAMLKDAALTIIDLVAELSRRGLTLKDAHPWNLLFDFTRPVYVDLTSIVPQADESAWAAYDEFCRFCYYPLILMAHGQERIARLLVPEYEGVTRRDLLTLMRGVAPSRFVVAKLFDRLASKLSPRFGKRPAASDLLKKIRRDVERIQLPACDNDDFSPRQDKNENQTAAPDISVMQECVSRILAESRPASMLDLSRGGTWTSLLPASQGCGVVSVSHVASRATAIYRTARHEKLPVLSLIMDFVKPTPAVGYSSHYAMAATERLKCEMVVALGLTDQLTRENHFTPQLIAEGLAAFSTRWLVVDIARSPSHALDEFRRALGERFSAVRIASLVNGRALLICEKVS
jgi:hypothetical protein